MKKTIVAAVVASVVFSMLPLGRAQGPATGPATAPAADEPGKWLPVQMPKNYRGQLGGFLAVDRTTGDIYFNSCGGGLWKSTDAAKTFQRLGDGKMFPSGPLGGDVLIGPDGKKVIVLNFVEANTIKPNTSGYSLDGGKTWEALTICGGGFNHGAVEGGDGKTLLAGANAGGWKLECSADLGQTWTELTRKNEGISGMGVFGPQELVLAEWSGIERSADGGKTWAKVSDIGWCGGPMLLYKDAACWMSPKGLVVSKDRGKTWGLRGAAPPSPGRNGFPPCLGKDENHFVVVTKEGVTETTDGAKTWKLVTALPGDYDAGNASFCFDPVHDAFYICYHWHAGKPVMKYIRPGVHGN